MAAEIPPLPWEAYDLQDSNVRSMDYARQNAIERLNDAFRTDKGIHIVTY